MNTQNSTALVKSEDTSMVEMNTSDLIGKPLDYAVAVAAGWPIEVLDMGFAVEITFQKHSLFPRATFCSPTTDWNQLGSLIVKYPIVLGNHESGENDGKFWGSAHCFFSGTSFDTKLGVMVAACRAMVALTLGQVVSVPNVLLRGNRP